MAEAKIVPLCPEDGARLDIQVKWSGEADYMMFCVVCDFATTLVTREPINPADYASVSKDGAAWMPWRAAEQKRRIASRALLEAVMSSSSYLGAPSRQDEERLMEDLRRDYQAASDAEYAAWDKYRAECEKVVKALANRAE